MKKGYLQFSLEKPKRIGNGVIPPVLILLSVLPGAFLSHFSAGLINIALPEISLSFHHSLSFTQWIITSYLLAIMIFLPIMGKLADSYGRKKIHNLGYVLLGVGAFLSALAPTLTFLLFSRIIQGIGAAMLQAVNMAIITASYPKAKRGKALGFIGTSVGLGGLMGPPSGGILIEWFSWKALFWIQVPLIIIAFCLSIRFIPKDKEGEQTSIDVLGGILFAIGMTAIIFSLNQIGEGGQLLYSVLLIGIGLGCLIIFTKWMKIKRNPFLNISSFSHPMIMTGITISVISYMVTFSAMVVLPFYLRGVLGISSSLSGLILMSYPLFLSFVGPISGSLSDKIGSSKVIIGGLMLMVISLVGFGGLSEQTTILYIITFLCLLGISMGILTSPNYNLMLAFIPASSMGVMSSTFALFRNVGMMIGTALGVSFMNLWSNGSITNSLIRGGQQNGYILLGFNSFFWLMTVITFCVIIAFIKVNREMAKNRKPSQEKTVDAM